MVILDELGVIRDVKTEWFPEATLHGFPRNKANTLRLQALARLLGYAYHHGVGVVVFEDLERIKKRRYTGDRSANRKITRFPKRTLLEHVAVMAMKYGSNILNEPISHFKDRRGAGKAIRIRQTYSISIRLSSESSTSKNFESLTNLLKFPK